MILLFENFELDVDRRELRRNTANISIEPRVFDLLAYLVHHRQRVVSKDDLITAIWDGRIVSESAVATSINAARVAVGDNGNEQRLIKTVTRKGVRFVGSVREAQATPVSAEKVPASASDAPLTLPDKPSIAVLPFQNMSGDPEQEYFADGIVDEIISGLARTKWLFVIARNSTFVYKSKAVDLRQIGRELAVRYLLQGGVRKAGDRIRVSTQLIDAENGAQLWSERFDRTVSDIFALQDDIALSVIGAMEPTLRNMEIERVKRTRPNSLDAYDLVLRASTHALSHIAEDAAMAIPLLHKALVLEPNYSGAHAPLALCYHSRFSRAGLRLEDQSAAIHHARAAVTCGADDAAALGIAGFVISLDAHDHVNALELFDRALSLSSSNFFALCSSALTLSWLGEPTVAIERSEHALRLSPFDPLNYLSLNAQAISYFQLEQFERSYEVARRSVELNPRFSVSRAFLTATLARLGRSEAAQAEAKQVLTLDPGFSVENFAITVGIKPRVFSPMADAWRIAGLP